MIKKKIESYDGLFLKNDEKINNNENEKSKGINSLFGEGFNSLFGEKNNK